MTLSEVAARIRLMYLSTPGAWAVIEAFEADPDFHLRERVEKLAEEFETMDDKPFPHVLCHQNDARRLREVLK